MKTTTETKTIQTTAETFARYNRLKRAAKAIERLAKAAEAALGIPEPSKETVGAYVIVDGNGAPLGKATIFFVEGGIIERKDGWRKRIS